MFELVVAINDTEFICHPIMIQYQKQQQLENDEFEWVHLIYGLQEGKPIVFYIRFINGITELPKNNISSYLSQINKSSFNE